MCGIFTARKAWFVPALPQDLGIFARPRTTILKDVVVSIITLELVQLRLLCAIHATLECGALSMSFWSDVVESV